jgi:hypothetical protein
MVLLDLKMQQNFFESPGRGGSTPQKRTFRSNLQFLEY